MKSLFHIVHWPVAVRAGSLFVAAIALTGIILGIMAPISMAKLGSPVSIPIHIGVLGAAILGVIGVRLFTWLAALLLSVYAIVAVPSVFRADLVGALIGTVWIVLLIAPTVFACRTEIKHARATKASPAA